jgi:hypothetical protein
MLTLLSCVTLLLRSTYYYFIPFLPQGEMVVEAISLGPYGV